mmetsp:Transcript_5829/g.18373  ORF Transcript_5829/g.18373 Transcript_5829/m.18373 type:complete len:108 (-) Transcript_5829:78-401(-)
MSPHTSVHHAPQPGDPEAGARVAASSFALEDEPSSSSVVGGSDRRLSMERPPTGGEGAGDFTLEDGETGTRTAIEGGVGRATGTIGCSRYIVDTAPTRTTTAHAAKM